MSKKLGNDYHLWIESSTPGTYNRIKGNTQLSRSRSGSSFSIGAKEDFPYDPQAGGTRTLTISATFRPDLPDADGYGRLLTLANSTSNAPFNIQIRKGGTSGATGDVVFEGSVRCNDLSDTMNQNAPVESTGTFVIASAPVTDTLL